MKNRNTSGPSAWLIIAAVILITGSLNAFPSGDKGLKNMDAFIDTAMLRWKVPGLAVGVIKDGEVVYCKAFGYRDLKTKEAVTTRTLFSIASMTKAFTATAAVMLSEEGKIDFDLPLKNYFPDFRTYDSVLTENITFKDLLTHRSGIPRQKFFSLNPPATRREVRECFRYFEPNQQFRSSWQYCNETYTVAGDMIAERAGTTWEELIKSRILAPLSMKYTIFSFKGLQENSDCARPYIMWDKDPVEMEYHDASILGAAGCIVSSIEDLLKWAEFNLNEGEYKGNQLLDESSLKLIQSPIVVIPSQIKSTSSSYSHYGMGWIIDQYRGKLHINHGGVLYGFSSKISLIPEEKTAIVILANLNGTPFTDVLERKIMDDLFELEPIDWHNKTYNMIEAQNKQMMAAMEEAEKNKKTQKPSWPLEKCTGNYTSNGYGSLNVRMENDSLKVRFSDCDGVLNYEGDDSFILYHPIEHMGWKTAFIKDTGNEVSAMTIQVSPNTKPVIFRRDNQL